MALAAWVALVCACRGQTFTQVGSSGSGSSGTVLTGPKLITAPSSIYGSGGKTIGINTNKGPGLDDFSSKLRVLSDVNGLDWLSQDSLTRYGGITVQSYGPVVEGNYLLASNYIGSAAGAYDMPLPTGLLGGYQRTPPLFVNGWWMNNNISQTGADVTNLVNMMVANGMVASGVTTIWIDDGWQGAARGGDGYPTWSVAKYPQGFTNLVPWIHSLGMKVGIYTSASTNTCDAFFGTPPQYVRNDVHFFGTNGFDAIKIDGCGTFGDPNTTSGAPNTMRAIGRRFGEAMMLETNHWWACAASSTQPFNWNQLIPSYINQTEDGLPTGVDTISNAFWCAHRNNDFVNGTYAKAGPNFWMEYQPIENASLTASTVKARMTAAAITASAMDIGWTNVAYLPFETNRVVNNYVFGDWAVLQPTVTRSNANLTEYWVRPLGTTNVPGRSNAVVLANYSAGSLSLTVPWSDLGYSATNTPMQVYDCWGLASLGIYNGAFTKTLAAGDVYLLIFAPAPNTAGAPVMNAFGPQTFYERDTFTHALDAQLNYGDLGWYVPTYGGGALVSSIPSTTGGPNFPRIGLVQIGNTSTTAGAGARATMLFANNSDEMPLERPDLWTNWSSHWAYKLTTTNTMQSYLGLMGGAAWGSITTDPSSGAYIRWCSTFESQAKFALVVKNGATVSTNYLGAADTSFHDFTIYNDTGVTNVVRCSMDGGAPVSVTNALGATSVGPVLNVNTTGGTAPAVVMDYYDLGINGITQ